MDDDGEWTKQDEIEALVLAVNICDHYLKGLKKLQL
jgi:hypothetical protein